MAADSNNYSGSISYKAPPLQLGGTNNGQSVNSGFNFDLPLATVAMFTNRALSFAESGSAARMGFFSNVNKNNTNLLQSTATRVLDYVGTTNESMLSYGREAIASTERTANTIQMSQNFRAILNNQTQQKVSKGGGCFITTAICQHMGKPDDCSELRTLREFRDTYMQSDVSLRHKVKEYYRVAPHYVDAIDALPENEAREFYEFLRVAYLEPAIECINRGAAEKALQYYESMVICARTKAQESLKSQMAIAGA